MEPLVNLRPYVVVSLKKRSDQEPWDAMQGVLDYGDRVGKLIVAVDEDINPRDPVAVTWAITHRSQPHKDIKVVGDRPFGATPIGMVATHPSSRYDNCESSLLIDATRKADFPPLSLPKKRIHGPSPRDLGGAWPAASWSRRSPGMDTSWDFGLKILAQEADLAAQSEHEKVWEKLRQTRVQVGEGETMKSMRAKWGKSHSGGPSKSSPPKSQHIGQICCRPAKFTLEVFPNCKFPKRPPRRPGRPEGYLRHQSARSETSTFHRRDRTCTQVFPFRCRCSCRSRYWHEGQLERESFCRIMIDRLSSITRTTGSTPLAS